MSRIDPSRAPLLTGIALLLGTATALAQPSTSPTQPAPPSAAAQYEQCLALARSNPQKGYDEATGWRDLGGGFPAEHCAAVALVALKRYPEAAAKLEHLAGAMMTGDPAVRSGALEQAGNAWLLAGRSSEAKADFDAALAFKPNDADTLIDRAEASAMSGKFFDAVDDLNRAIEIAPNRADALIYRASAYRQLNSLDLALDDAEHALSIEPDAVAGLLERGNIRRLKGDREGAKADWQRIAQLAPGSNEARAAVSNLMSLESETKAANTAASTPKP